MFHDRHAIGQFQCFVLVVRDEHTGEADLLLQFAQPAAHFLAHARVQRAKGFIQQQDARLDGQRTGQCHALALSARELVRQAIAIARQLHQLQQLAHAPAHFRCRRSLRTRADVQAKGHVLEHAHVPEQRVVLEHETHLPVARIARDHVHAVEQHRAAIREIQPGDDAQQGRLARA